MTTVQPQNSSFMRISEGDPSSKMIVKHVPASIVASELPPFSVLQDKASCEDKLQRIPWLAALLVADDVMHVLDHGQIDVEEFKFLFARTAAFAFGAALALPDFGAHLPKVFLLRPIFRRRYLAFVGIAQHCAGSHDRIASTQATFS
jgi:hypothetical protein